MHKKSRFQKRQEKLNAKLSDEEFPSPIQSKVLGLKCSLIRFQETRDNRLPEILPAKCCSFGGEKRKLLGMFALRHKWDP